MNKKYNDYLLLNDVNSGSNNTSNNYEHFSLKYTASGELSYGNNYHRCPAPMSVGANNNRHYMLEPFQNSDPYGCDCSQFTPSGNNPTQSPTLSPTQSPTLSPTQSPTLSPTQSPTLSPTQSPTLSPTQSPTLSPTQSPTQSPTGGNLCSSSGWDTKWANGTPPEHLSWDQISKVWNEVNPNSQAICGDALKIAAGEANPYPPGNGSDYTGLMVNTVNSDSKTTGLWQISPEWWNGTYNLGVTLPSDFVSNIPTDPCRQAKLTEQVRKVQCPSQASFCPSGWTGGPSYYESSPAYKYGTNKTTIADSCSKNK